MDGTHEKVAAIIEKYIGSDDGLIPILQDVQAEYHYLPEDAVREVARQRNLPLIQVYGVATFFKSFSLKPRGKHIINVCMGTACHVRNSQSVLAEVARKLGIGVGETTGDGEYTLETVNCLGACALGPIVVADDTYYSQMTPGKVKKVLAQQ